MAEAPARAPSSPRPERARRTLREMPALPMRLKKDNAPIGAEALEQRRLRQLEQDRRLGFQEKREAAPKQPKAAQGNGR